MMVKSVSPSSRGRYNLKKKKIWIKNDSDSDSDSDSVEIEIEVYDLSDYSIYFYNKSGKIILHKEEKQQLNILV